MILHQRFSIRLRPRRINCKTKPDHCNLRMKCQTLVPTYISDLPTYDTNTHNRKNEREIMATKTD